MIQAFSNFFRLGSSDYGKSNLADSKRGGTDSLLCDGTSWRLEAFFWSNYSDLTRPHPKWWFSKGHPLISGKSRLVKYYNLTRILGG